ncbi:MAG: 5'/3'-nucleotidase SurE [Clostridia bacterium]|jgi:5'-nucleotidase|nr:5'/3'-nucleotidase SurE [Spirochaetia bacterium]
MRILLTNDDGYMATGLIALETALSREHEVWILAPDGERSGMSHALSLRHPLKIRKISERRYACSGTPVDCVILAAHGVLPFKPDIVVSGINRGPNLGTDLVYSGTAAAARQASMIGLPGIAASLASFVEPYRYTALASLIANNLHEFIAAWDPEVFINLNAPDARDDMVYDVEETVPSRRRYRDTLKFFDGPDKYTYCFFGEGTVETDPESGTDEDAVRRGFASMTRIAVYPHAAGEVAGLPRSIESEVLR